VCEIFQTQLMFVEKQLQEVRLRNSSPVMGSVWNVV